MHEHETKVMVILFFTYKEITLHFFSFIWACFPWPFDLSCPAILWLNFTKCVWNNIIDDRFIIMYTDWYFNKCIRFKSLWCIDIKIINFLSIKIARRKEIKTNKKISSYHYMNNFTASIVKLIQSDLNMADLTVDTWNYRPL